MSRSKIITSLSLFYSVSLQKDCSAHAVSLVNGLYVWVVAVYSPYASTADSIPSIRYSRLASIVYHVSGGPSTRGEPALRKGRRCPAGGEFGSLEGHLSPRPCLVRLGNPT